jgi:signal transduction histidine kinase
MIIGNNFAPNSRAVRQGGSRVFWWGALLASVVVLVSVVAAIFLPQGFALAAFGDSLQLALIVATTVLCAQNFLRTQSRARAFWGLICSGSAIWTASTFIWSYYEVWLRQPVPDVPVVDVLLFVKIVPLTIALAAVPDRDQDSPFRTFGLIDFSVLMIYSLYLYAFTVFGYRLVPGGTDVYNFRFNLADSIGNQILLISAATALLTSRGNWRPLYRLYFLAAATYFLASNLSNAAIDLGHYYTGSLYDIPLVAALAALLSVPLAGRRLEQGERTDSASNTVETLPGKTTFISSHLAMLAALSTPIIGIWLLADADSSSLLHQFRLAITLLTMFLLTLLFSIKQDFLTAGLVRSLARLSETYSSIDRFKSRLTQSEKLAALGELVAEVAIQIKGCMNAILEASHRLSSRPDAESRLQSMAGKIAQYAQRTDALVDNMLHFAQEMPLRLAPLAVKPLLESALQLSRVAKRANVHVAVVEEGEGPVVRGDSSQLLHVFVQLISNAVDALEEVQGGTIEITIRRVDAHAVLDFADSGPGVKEPARVFEPFYTTKAVGKGTGLGLSTCYGILQQHEGEISCRNRLTGGAVFTLRIPLVSEAPTTNNSSGAVLVEGGR